MNFQPRDRVITPNGPGVIVSMRMAPPNYSKAESYSVILDSKRNQLGYSGSVYPAEQVQALNEVQEGDYEDPPYWDEP